VHVTFAYATYLLVSIIFKSTTKFKLMSSGFQCYVVLQKDTNISEDLATSIFTLNMEAAQSVSLHSITTRRSRFESLLLWKPQILQYTSLLLTKLIRN